MSVYLRYIRSVAPIRPIRRPSIHPPVHPSIRPSIRPSICPSIHLSIRTHYVIGIFLEQSSSNLLFSSFLHVCHPSVGSPPLLPPLLLPPLLLPPTLLQQGLIGQDYGEHNMHGSRRPVF